MANDLSRLWFVPVNNLLLIKDLGTIPNWETNDLSRLQLSPVANHLLVRDLDTIPNFETNDLACLLYYSNC